MSFSYSSSLTSDVDAVRFLVPDKVTPNHALENEEIAAVIAQQPSNGQSGLNSSAVYYAAAVCLSRLHRQYMTAGKGKTSKKVSRLAIVYGTGAGINIDIAIQKAISELRKEGARLLAEYADISPPGSYVFRAL